MESTAALASLLRLQDGVISRRQILELGGTDNDIERWCRRARLARVHEGVYVEHTGPLTREQRWWSAVLCHEPAALTGLSALRAHRIRGPWLGREEKVVQLLVSRTRRLHPAPGVELHRSQHFDQIAQLHLSPPRVAVEHAALGAASSARDDAAAVAVLADLCQQRRTTVGRLLEAIELRPRLPRRRLLVEILVDIDAGAFSVLERRYLSDVERKHGLPRGHRQRRVDRDRPISRAPAGPGGVIFRDVEYLAHLLLVELDGRLGHEWSEDRWLDLDRDIGAAISNRLTIRPGWRQVLEPCRLAAAVALILRARGWAGWPVACGPDCTIRTWLNIGDSPARGAGESPLSRRTA
ncbi:type IV toxin-antitoxin system AbiEi family antitoxin domain-containing protein [Nocardioides sp. Root140]|uniref:type IV toxin-antitoxin system AbiEi family antitoxin domain-containing protein n=1 Tax=Nocardioides sp. Root140 TaxID=1736460 RepID=UPI0006F589F8|nr:type IV toxin-antitoxin system AbiEi family antitoxin domain-containing protein [Nocardioides sp. Root140]